MTDEIINGILVLLMFIVKVIAVLNPGFPEAWRMVEAGQIAGFAYIWLLVFLVLLCCFCLLYTSLVKDK